MTKSILLSVSPTEALNVLNGKQTALLRKRVPKGYVGWCYGVVSKGGKRLVKWRNIYMLNDKYVLSNDELINGKIPFRFWYEEVDKLEYHKRNDVLMWDDNYYYYTKDNVYNNVECILDELQLEHQEVLDYGNGKDLYAISITKLEVFDKPMELGEVYKQIHYPNGETLNPNICDFPNVQKAYNHNFNDCLNSFKLTKSPSTYQYVWVKE